MMQLILIFDSILFAYIILKCVWLFFIEEKTFKQIYKSFDRRDDT